jgi:aspartate carbamoyltransferase catalytic subunit
MQIVDAYECSVHTHYLTDGERMRTADVQAVERAMKELLASLDIVYPLRIRSDKEQGKLHLVLECRPMKRDAERIQKRLAEVLAPLPIRPATTVKIEGGEPPLTGQPAPR